MEILAIFVPLAGAVVAWFANEWRKRTCEEYQRKEERYRELIRSLKGFYVSSWSGDESKRYKNEFIDQLNLCWMYCPDDVIRKAYTFIDTVHTGQRASDEEKQQALGALVLAIRKDLISRRLLSGTELNPESFRILTSA